ncbi:hypothetical protein FB451DRAFT_1393769 [Mycena latifolia]|nr:hypothetical protein FB451DRAFT_1393769 [Mycena latifolia]
MAAPSVLRLRSAARRLRKYLRAMTTMTPRTKRSHAPRRRTSGYRTMSPEALPLHAHQFLELSLHRSQRTSSRCPMSIRGGVHSCAGRRTSPSDRWICSARCGHLQQVVRRCFLRQHAPSPLPVVSIPSLRRLYYQLRVRALTAGAVWSASSSSQQFVRSNQPLPARCRHPQEQRELAVSSSSPRHPRRRAAAAFRPPPRRHSPPSAVLQIYHLTWSDPATSLRRLDRVHGAWTRHSLPIRKLPHFQLLDILPINLPATRILDLNSASAPVALVRLQAFVSHCVPDGTANHALRVLLHLLRIPLLPAHLRQGERQRQSAASHPSSPWPERPAFVLIWLLTGALRIVLIPGGCPPARRTRGLSAARLTTAASPLL